MAIKLDFSENLSSYKLDLEKDLSSLESEVNSISLSLGPISKNQISIIENLLKDSEMNLRNIEVELSCLPQTTKEKYSIYMKSYKEKINKIKSTYQELKSVRNKYEQNESKSEASEKLLKINKNLNKGTNMAAESIRVMANVNQMDKETMVSLKKQTEIIIDSTQKLHDADSFLKRSGNVLDNMLKRIATNKLVLFALIILLGIINVFLVYIKIKFKFFGK